jgi:uncharacterized delta-60 repeat protein
MSPSGNVVLPSSVLGQSSVFVAFRIVSPGTGAAQTSRWRIDDFALVSQGDPTAPVITLSTTAIPDLASVLGQEGTAQSFQVSGANLTGNLTVNAPANFQVSTTSATEGFGPTATITASGTLPGTNVWVRIASTASVGSIGPANVTVTGGGATERTVAVSGTVTDPNVPSLSVSPTTLPAFSTPQGTASTAQTFSITAANLTGDVVITPPTGFAVSADGTTFSTAPINIAVAQFVSPATISVRLTGATEGSPSGNVVVTSGDLAANVAVSGTVGPPPVVPTITVSPSSITNLEAVAGSAGTGLPFQVSGSNLTGHLTVSAPDNFEVSITSETDGFRTTEVIIASGTLDPTDVWVRINAEAKLGEVLGTVDLVSGDAEAAVEVSGVVILPAPLVVMTSPVEGTVSRPGKDVALRAEVQTTGATQTISSFEFLANDVTIASLADPQESPAEYETDWQPAAGEYQITGRATDADGSVGVSEPVTLIVRPEQEGEPLDSFVPPSANGAVRALAADAAGLIYVGGSFSQLQSVDANGEPFGPPVDARRIARLTSGGGIDTSFNVGTGPNGSVQAMVHTPAGLLVGGGFTKVNGVDRIALARIGPGGAVDSGFDAAIVASASANPAMVQALLVQPDGKILIGGSFDQVGDSVRSNLARLEADGSLDTTFDVPVDGVVNAIARQADGKILIGGSFSAVHGVTARRLARVEADGTLDTTFNTGTGTANGFNSTVQSVAVTATGRIYVAGSFTAYQGTPWWRYLAQLRPDGTIEPVFNYLGGLNFPASRVLVVPGTEDVLVAGEFTSAANNALWSGSEQRGRVALFESTGELSPAFNPGGSGANGPVNDALQLSDGNWLLAGNFTTFNGEPRAGLVVLAGPDYGQGGYESWVAVWGLVGPDADPDAVLNPAGISNLLVYALGGGDPRTATPDILPQSEWLGGEDGFYLSLRAPGTTRAQGVEYLGEYSRDLQSWTAEGVLTEFVPPGNDLLIRAPRLEPGDTRQFLRLKVLQP